MPRASDLNRANAPPADAMWQLTFILRGFRARLWKLWGARPELVSPSLATRDERV